MKKTVKTVAFLGNSDRDGVLNSNHRRTGQGKMAGDLGEQVPRVTHGIPSRKRVGKVGNCPSSFWQTTSIENLAVQSILVS